MINFLRKMSTRSKLELFGVIVLLIIALMILKAQ